MLIFPSSFKSVEFHFGDLVLSIKSLKNLLRELKSIH